MASLVLVGFWIFISFVIFLLSTAYIVIPKLPQFLKDILLYGKARGNRKQWSVARLIEIPKRWFLHFYLVGTAVNAYMVYTLATVYLLGLPPPHFLVMALRYVAPQPVVTINAMTAIFLVALMFIQNLRRLLECLFVSVYSDSTINVVHYIAGIALYSTFHLAVLSEAPDLYTYRVNKIDDEIVSVRNMVAIGIFTWASYQHHQAHQGFADLRKNRQGKVVNYEHQIPVGGWFDLISCPHYFFEMLIYIVFQIIAGLQHYTLMSVVAFVVINQLVAGYLTHKWYRGHFKQYPRQRKAVVPFLF